MNFSVFIEAQRQLFAEVDTWFAGAVGRLPAGAVQCRSGCSACCRGLFDISLLEAFCLRQELEGLPPAIRERVQDRARRQVECLRRHWPNWRPPFLLNGMAEDDWQTVAADSDDPCVLLDEEGRCLLYDLRPMTCRLHGLPAFDPDGGDFSSALCSRNRLAGAQVPSYPFRDLFAREAELLRAFHLQLTGRPFRELDTFIPAALLLDVADVDWAGRLLTDPRGHIRSG